MAEVFLARSEGEAGFGKLVAFRILQPAFAAQPDGAVDLFLDEARLVAGLDHPNIVQTHDLDAPRVVISSPWSTSTE